MQKKKPHFKLPEGYFEGFTSRMMERIAKEEAVLPKTDGFKMPEGYLDTLDLNIPREVNEQKSKVISLSSRRRRWYMGATAVAAILLVLLGLRQLVGTSNELAIEDLASADIEAYFETNGLELSPYEIAEVLPVDELGINAVLEEDFETDDLMDYLEENLDDIENLNLEEDE